MIIHLWATCETALSKFPGTDFSNVGADIELLQGGSLAEDPVMYWLHSIVHNHDVGIHATINIL